MNSNDNKPSSQSETISIEFELQHSPEKVWRALTDAQLLAEWLLPVAGFELAPGTTFTFTAPPQPGWDGTVHCRLLELEPLRKISYTWVVGTLDTAITFTLTPTESGTHLALEHTGFKPEQKQNLAGARYGWKMMTGQLVAFLEAHAHT